MNPIVASWRYATLTGVLVVVVLLTSPVGDAGYELVAGILSASAVLVVCVLAVEHPRWLRRLLLVMAVFGIAGDVILPSLPSTPLVLAVRGDFALMLGLAVAAILTHILGSGRVTSDTIMGGISVYLLIGLLFSALFGIVEYLSPGSFTLGGVALDTLSDERNIGRYPQLLYYSLVTLTTLGYGDIIPTRSLPRMLAAMEAVIGQLYIAILIAGLVGMRLSHRQQAPR
jgi:hypothetical protein